MSKKEDRAAEERTRRMAAQIRDLTRDNNALKVDLTASLSRLETLARCAKGDMVRPVFQDLFVPEELLKEISDVRAKWRLD